MYRLDPAAVYALPELLDDPVWAARIEGILRACDHSADDLVPITRDSLADVVGAIHDLGHPEPRRRALVFTRLNTGGEQPDWDGLLARCPEGTTKGELLPLFGCAENMHFRRRDFDQEQNHVCWCAWEFNTIWGCPHGCQYCGMGRTGNRIVVGANVEEYAEKVVRPALVDYPWQKCFRLLGDAADQITFEPEAGAYEAIARVMSEFPDHYLITHTAGDNVYWLADFPYRDRIIHVYSLTSEDYAAALEPDTPTPAERISAAAFVESLGIPSRPKLKPIIPLRNWREDYERLLADLFARSRPQSVGLCVLMWMDLAQAREFLDLDQLEPAFAEAMVEREEALRGVRTGPFPHAVRAEVYRFLIEQIRRWDKRVPIYVSTESREMWDELGDVLGQSKRAFLCGCGPMATPDGRLRLSADMRFTTYAPEDA
jgi:DNA repair photolyase